jgi:ribosomal protein S18 acetylase RimI-like enzyme
VSEDAATARRLLEFELALDASVCEELVEEEWGRAFLCPGLDLVYDASFLTVERPGTTMAEVAELAEEVLGGAGLGHRTVVVLEPAEAARLAGELAAAPGWELERTDYMVWERESGRRPRLAVAEVSLTRIAALRAELIEENLAEGSREPARTARQLVELGRRCGAVAGDRWFVAPAADPQAACCLLSDGTIGQVEDVGTLARARGRGLAQAVVLAALAASRTAGHELTFLSAEADDWPRLMYAKLGFRKVGGILILRRFPT